MLFLNLSTQMPREESRLRQNRFILHDLHFIIHC
jgi:hypothetical protein